ncbi:hypothetical protein Pmar_PMAR013291 [Perkinsus marinus ATCC 50983]|uniref:Late embryogenesis abundant protein LEA-2 subgroup domain-containing protein n=1 Tax=Perkinsus marinus (strain ATCC 50983 / TXsc) TaxID=423536 RepID=C5LEZ2_PERM5|nr:hypothetical protein Pmar_PMAR013291 [Perkinsus marinus ATCC 50983]EER04758.1 hypothetical protein Pmar_PMAR013291 [Perkinsus marinus ATCC 50983]|eukprot:XP_002772942.1 hypothetical protein Pmar_PMAR013291 [Perkinsus marinus ATCC 50983]
MITLIITVLLVAVAGDVTADDYQMMVNKCDAQVDCISKTGYITNLPSMSVAITHPTSATGVPTTPRTLPVRTSEGLATIKGRFTAVNMEPPVRKMHVRIVTVIHVKRLDANGAVVTSNVIINIVGTARCRVNASPTRNNAVTRANQLDRELAMQTRQRMARRRELSDGADDYLLHDAGSDTGLEIGERMRGSDVLSLASLLDPCASCLYKTLGCCWAVGMVLLLVVSILIALAWPHQPVVNYCNVELVWNRTLAMVVESALVKTDIEMESLVSIYNPNRLGARINQLSGNIYYKGAGIGTMALHNFEAPGGYVSDGLGLITYNALDRAAEMLIDYKWNKDLVLTVTGTISFDILWPNSEVLTSLSASLPPAVINVNKVPDQRYCKCQGNVTKGS